MVKTEKLPTKTVIHVIVPVTISPVKWNKIAEFTSVWDEMFDAPNKQVINLKRI